MSIRHLAAAVAAIALSSHVAVSAQTTYLFPLSSAQEVPTNASAAKGVGIIVLNAAQTQISVTVYHNVVNATAAHIHQQVAGVNGGVIFNLGVSSNPIIATINVSPAQVTTLMSAGFYVNVHSMVLPGGEIRGQIVNAMTPQLFISEFCANPVGMSSTLDTNGDGDASALRDEFVEVVNGTNATVDLTGWHVCDAAGIRHFFKSGTMLPPAGAIVVFGGGSVTAFNTAGGRGVPASEGLLSLDDGGDLLELRDAASTVIDSILYGAATGGTSSTANPATAAGAFVDHSTIGGISHSAGFLNDNLTRWPAATLPTNLRVYEGNGSDARIGIALNGMTNPNTNGVYATTAGTAVTMNFTSPGGALALAPFLAVAQVFATPSIPAPILLPGDAAAYLVASPLAPAAILADGLSSPGALFAPVLDLTLTGFIPPSLSGMNLSVIINCLPFDLGRNAVNLGIAPAAELVVL